MKSIKLYAQLEKDFITPKMSDEWDVSAISEFVSDNFKKRNMGLMLDNTDEIKKVYTAVFPSEKVLDEILENNEQDVLLLVHHPMVWDITLKGKPFRHIPLQYLRKLKKSKIAIYALHVPLDNNGTYSTAATLAKAVGARLGSEEFYEYYGVKVGVVGKTSCRTIKELANKVKKSVGHKVKINPYGESVIRDRKVAFVGGGGLDPEIIPDIAGMGINVFVTGVTKLRPHYQKSVDAHDLAKRYKLNIIGATHYSTEKFACIAMCKYFKKLGLAAEFIEDKPVMEDM